MVKKLMAWAQLLLMAVALTGNLVSIALAEDMEEYGCKDSFCWNAPWICRERHGSSCSCGVYWCGS